MRNFSIAVGIFRYWSNPLHCAAHNPSGFNRAIFSIAGLLLARVYLRELTSSSFTHALASLKAILGLSSYFLNTVVGEACCILPIVTSFKDSKLAFPLLTNSSTKPTALCPSFILISSS